MGSNLELLRPEQKHGEADAIRRSGFDTTNSPLLAAVIEAVNNHGGYNGTASITLYGITTREFCIVPCPDNDNLVTPVIQYMVGHSYYCERYRVSASLENPSKYEQALVVCWDPRIIQKSCMPKYYSTREGIRVPCGECHKHKSDDVVGCEGCALLRIWLPGVLLMKNSGQPCKKCNRSGKHKEGYCDDCPATLLYRRLYPENPDGEGVGDATNVDPLQGEVASETTDTPVSE